MLLAPHSPIRAFTHYRLKLILEWLGLVGYHIVLYFLNKERKYSRKKIASNAQTTEGYHSSVCQEKYMLNALKGNADKMQNQY